MTDIPEDILSVAAKAYAESPVKVVGALDGGAIVRVIAAAILAERERCAETARGYANGFEKALYLYGAADVDAGRGRQEGHINAGREIADLISCAAHTSTPTETEKAAS